MNTTLTNEVMLGNLIETKMSEFEKRRRYTMSEEFYELTSEEQDKLIIENRELKKEIDRLKVRINSLSFTNQKLVDENKNLTNELSKVLHDGSLWLGDVLKIENPRFGSNNLIISPVGSGKTFAITELFAPKGSDIQLLLVSTTHLKNSIAPDIDGDMKRKQDSMNVFTTANKKAYGRADNKLWVMTYAEFGMRIKINDDFITENGITDIYCDEIHSLIEYKGFAKSEPLIIAMRYLLQKTEGVVKYYFTATTEKLEQLSKENKEWFAEIKTFDYSNYKDIKKYTAMSEVKFSHIEQLREQLRNHSGDFIAYGKKGLFFSNKITTLRTMEQMLIEEGFTPLVLWSTNNEDNRMSDEQLRALDVLVETERIPEGYNFLLINGAMREGWNLNDNNVELVIINSTSETDIIQARGRVRKNISTLILRTDELNDIVDVEVPEQFLNGTLTIDTRNELIEMLNIVNDKGQLSGWTVVKKILNHSGYDIKESRSTIDGERVRVVNITKM